jgi:hypothetical protein
VSAPAGRPDDREHEPLNASAQTAAGSHCHGKRLYFRVIPKSPFTGKSILKANQPRITRIETEKKPKIISIAFELISIRTHLRNLRISLGLGPDPFEGHYIG